MSVHEILILTAVGGLVASIWILLVRASVCRGG